MSEGMSLEEYVKATLLGIVRAVVAAQEDEVVGGLIGRASYGSNTVKDESDNAVTNVAFDLATTVEQGTSAGGNAGVKVIPFIQAEAGGKVSDSQSTVSRIAFEIPIAVPRPSAQRQEDQDRAEERRKREARNSAIMRNLGETLG